MTDFALRQDELDRHADYRRRFETDLAAFANGTRQSSRELLAAMAACGALGLAYPQSLGGAGLDWLEYGFVLEQLAAVSGDLAVMAHLQNVYPRLASAELQKEVASGRAIVALADREAGVHEPLNVVVKTAAVRDDQGYVISGHKTSVLLGPLATHFIVTASTETDRGERGTSLFLVAAGSPGMKVAAFVPSGLPLTQIATVQFTDLRVPADHLIGEPNSGDAQLRSLWPLTRGVRLFADISAALESIRFMVEDTKKKFTFGKPLLKWQAIQFKLSDAQTNLEMLRTMAQYLAWAVDQDLEVTAPGVSLEAYASMLHRLFGEFGRRAFEDTLELGSGRAFRKDHFIWQRYMDHLALRLLDGGTASDTEFIAREAFGPEWLKASDGPRQLAAASH